MGTQFSKLGSGNLAERCRKHSYLMLGECSKSGIHATHTYLLSRSSSLNSLQAQLGARRNSASSLGGGKENVPSFPMLELLAAPPELSEETLLAPEHKEILGKLKFVCTLVDTILEVNGINENHETLPKGVC